MLKLFIIVMAVVVSKPAFANNVLSEEAAQACLGKIKDSYRTYTQLRFPYAHSMSMLTKSYKLDTAKDSMTVSIEVKMIENEAWKNATVKVLAYKVSTGADCQAYVDMPLRDHY